MTSSSWSLARRPLNLNPCWLTSTVVTCSENGLPSQSVPKTRTGTSTAFRGSFALPIYVNSEAAQYYSKIGCFIQIIRNSNRGALRRGRNLRTALQRVAEVLRFTCLKYLENQGFGQELRPNYGPRIA